MARFLSPEWVDDFNAAVGDVELPAPGAEAGIAAGTGAYAWSQVVTDAPGGPADGVAVTLRVADGHLHMETGSAPDAAVTIRIGWDDARAAAALSSSMPTGSLWRAVRAPGRVR